MNRDSSFLIKTTVLTGAVASAFAGALVLFFCDPARAPIYPPCLFHQLTGLSCPGCGSLRALHALLHGHWVAALHFNLLLVASLPLFAWLGFRVARSELRGGPALNIRPFWLWLYVAACIAFGVLRNVPVPFFTVLAP